MPYVCDCGKKLDLIAALDALPADRMGSSGMFCPSCSSCGKSLELRLNNGSFVVGYSYFGGGMHFEPMKTIRLTGLKITRGDPDDLDVVIGKRRWHFGVTRFSNSRFIVFAQSFAAGKRLSQLNLGEWGVTVTAIERGRTCLEALPETVIESGDFLRLAGPAPALTRAWRYMNEGISRKSDVKDGPLR